MEYKHGDVFIEGDSCYLIICDSVNDVRYYTCLVWKGKPFDGNLLPLSPDSFDATRDTHFNIAQLLIRHAK